MDYKKISPFTNKPEEPLAIFDELITNNNDTEEKLAEGKEKAKTCLRLMGPRPGRLK